MLLTREGGHEQSIPLEAGGHTHDKATRVITLA